MAEQSTEKSFLMLVKGISKGTRAPWRKRFSWQLGMTNGKYKRVKWQSRCLWESWKRRKERNISNSKFYFRAKPNVRSYPHLLKKLLARQDGSVDSVDKGAAAKPDHLGSIHEAHVMERENQLPKIVLLSPCPQVFRKLLRGSRPEGSQWEKINDYA